MISFNRTIAKLKNRQIDNTPLEYSLRYHLQDSSSSSKLSSTKCELESEGEVDSDQEYPSIYAEIIFSSTSENTTNDVNNINIIKKVHPFQTRHWESDICFDDSDHDNTPLTTIPAEEYDTGSANEDEDIEQGSHSNRKLLIDPAMSSCSMLNIRLANGEWENNVIWDATKQFPRQRSITPIRLPRDDMELILSRKTTGIHHAVDDIAKQIQTSIQHANVNSNKNHQQHNQQQNQQQHDRLQLHHWLGLRGGSFKGYVPVIAGNNTKMIHDQKKKIARKETVLNSNIASKHMLLKSQLPLVYSSNLLSFHRPLLMTYCYESKTNVRRPRKIVWECGWIKHEQNHHHHHHHHRHRRRSNHHPRIHDIDDLSLQEEGGSPVVVEYMEERPPLSLNAGMATSVNRYSRRGKGGHHEHHSSSFSSSSATPLHTLSSFGKHVYISNSTNGPKLPILGQLPMNGDDVTVVESGLFVAPAQAIKISRQHHEENESKDYVDFLVASPKEVALKKMNMNSAFKVGVVMKMPDTCVVVGQVEPRVPVYRPGKQSKNIKLRIQKLKIILLLNKLKANEWMQEKDIEQSFRTYNYNTKEARTVLNRLYDENDSPVESKKLKKTKAWRLSGNKVKKKSTVSKYLKTVTPEEICRYEGMIEGCNLLIKAGMTRAVRQGKKRVDGLIGLLDDNKKWMRFQSILKKLKRKLIYRQYLLEKLKKEEKNLKNTDKLKILSNLRIHINRLRDMIDKDEEQIRCSQYIYNQLQTSPWNITSNFVNVHVHKTDKRSFQISGVGDPSGCGEGYSCILNPAEINRRVGRPKKKDLSTTSSSSTSNIIQNSSLSVKTINEKQLNLFLLNHSKHNNIKNWPKMRKVLHVQQLINQSNELKSKLKKLINSHSNSDEEGLTKYQKRLNIVVQAQMNFLKNGTSSNAIKHLGSSAESSANNGNVVQQLQQQLLGDDNNDTDTTDKEKFMKKRNEFNNILIPKIYQIQLTNYEKRAKTNYCNEKETSRDPGTVSLDEIASSIKGLKGWSSINKNCGRGGEDSLRSSPVTDLSLGGYYDDDGLRLDYENVHVKTTIRYSKNGSSRECRTYTINPLKVKEYTNNMLLAKKLENDLEHMSKRIQYQSNPYEQYKSINTLRKRNAKSKNTEDIYNGNKRKAPSTTPSETTSTTTTNIKIKNEIKIVIPKTKKAEKFVFKMPPKKKKKGNKDDSIAQVKKTKKRKRETRGSIAELNELLQKVLHDSNVLHYKQFFKKVNRRAYPDYYNIIKKPICLEDIKKKAELRKAASRYQTLDEFKSDIHLLTDNCIQYNGPTAPISLDAKVKIRDAIMNVIASKKNQFEDIARRSNSNNKNNSFTRVSATSYVPPPPITSVTPVSRDSSESNSNKTNMGGMINIEEDDEENDFNLVMSDY